MLGGKLQYFTFQTTTSKVLWAKFITAAHPTGLGFGNIPCKQLTKLTT
jgi:hypothetical protein